MKRILARAGWSASSLAVALALAVAVLVVAASAGLIFYSVREVDALRRAQEMQLITRGIERSGERLKADLTSVTVWNEAYDRTARAFDPLFAQVNFGTYFHDYLAHDVSVVLDPQDRPLYASIDGVAVKGARARALALGVAPLAAQARRNEAIRASMPLGLQRVGLASGTARLRGRLHLAAASTLMPQPTYEQALLPGPPVVVVTAKEIGPTYLSTLKANYGVATPRLLSPNAVTSTSVPLRSVDGEVMGKLAWTPNRPGLSVYHDAGLEMSLAALALVLVVGGLIWLLRVLAADLVQARDRAEAGDRAKSEFIANMSHEIRTPLNGVLGMAQVMEAHDLSPDQRERLAVVRESGATLLALLNDVLDLSKIDAGKLEIVEGTFRLDELAERVCGAFAGLAVAKGISLERHVDPAVAGYWTGDSLRLRQVLSNLLSNATKFTEAGGVVLSVSEAPGGVRFEVRDTGIGIDERRLPDLFEKFTQADASTTRRYGGTGLGLAISHSLIKIMGGTIWATSREEGGSVFTVVLPLRRAADEAPVAIEPEPEICAEETRPLRVLAAEDNPTNQLVLRALLDTIEAEVTMVSDGQQAIDAFAPGAFDVVLMDVQMPQMSGPDATIAIRALERRLGVAPTPILALTANVMRHQVESYLEAGMDGHIAKPLDLARFYAAIDEVLSARDADRAAA